HSRNHTMPAPSAIVIDHYTDTSNPEVPQSPTSLPPAFRAKGSLQALDSEGGSIVGSIYDDTGARIAQETIDPSADWSIEFNLGGLHGTGNVNYNLKVDFNSPTNDNASDTAEITVQYP